MTPIRENARYAAYYCEENVWHLAQEPELEGKPTCVIFVSNSEQKCVFWHQRTQRIEGTPVLWDYHVVLAVHEPTWVVYDLDSTLPWPTPLDLYLERTFRGGRVPDEFAPRFRVVPKATYVSMFASDRSHMKTPAGTWTHAPPAWPPIQSAESSMNLPRFWRVDPGPPGRVCAISELNDVLDETSTAAPSLV
jgi:protein N-terminal glutamine amidohydrolase